MALGGLVGASLLRSLWRVRASLHPHSRRPAPDTLPPPFLTPTLCPHPLSNPNSLWHQDRMILACAHMPAFTVTPATLPPAPHSSQTHGGRLERLYLSKLQRINIHG